MDVSNAILESRVVAVLSIRSTLWRDELYYYKENATFLREHSAIWFPLGLVAPPNESVEWV